MIGRAGQATGGPRRRGFGLSVPSQVLAVLCVMYLVLYVERVNIATIAPAMTADLGLTNAQFGLAVSAFSYPYALIQLFGGWISDRFGTRRTLLFCGALVTVATMLTGLVGGLASLFALRLALGFGEGFAFPSATRAIATWLPVSRWGFAQGITHAAARLGNALTPPLVVAVLTFASWRGAFVALGLFNLIWVALWFWVARDDPRSHPGMTPDDIAALPPVSTRSKTPPVRWWRLARRIAPVTAVDFCYGWTLWVFLTWLPSFFFKNFHLDLAHSALFSAGVLLGGVAGDAVGGLVSDRIYRATGNLQAARRNVIITGMLGAFVFLIPVVLTHDLTTVAICLSIAFFFSELVVAPIWAVPMDIAPDHAGAASGMMNFGFGLAGILSPLVFGAVLDLTGSWTAPFLASIALLLVGAGLSFFMRPDRPFDPGDA
ncbi:MFS transporter [Sphingomonas sp. PvP056]|uniref:MFS transporter n=1 Tax=Sphingomonas sp. PvP056 TaxID=3156392 RepID=UPI003398A565